MISAVIFDLDGLLIDSEPLQYKAYNHSFSKYGYPLSEKDWITWAQNSYSASRWIEERKLPLDPQVIRATKKEIYDQLIQDEITLKEGAMQLISFLHSKYPLCIASSSRLESIQACLGKFNLETYFKVIQSGLDVPNPKPHPDIYTKIATELAVKPSECLVLENSISGLCAAKSAGMKCIACPDTYDDVQSPEYLQADKIIDSLSEVTIETILTLESLTTNH